MSQKVTFDIGITPISAEGFAELEMIAQAIDADNKKAGAAKCATLKCATFAQIKYGNGTRIIGRLFTGEAVKYLSKHIGVAACMQDEQEAEPPNQEAIGGDGESSGL